jgi:hypothetical protein
VKKAPSFHPEEGNKLQQHMETGAYYQKTRQCPPWWFWDGWGCNFQTYTRGPSIRPWSGIYVATRRVATG